MQPTASATGTPATPYKSGIETAPADRMLTSAKDAEFWSPISQTLSTTNPGPTTWPQPRPTLSGGIPSGRMSGTPAQIARSDDGSALPSDDTRARNKNTPGHQSMRRTIQDLVASVDPNVKVEPEVEDVSTNLHVSSSSVEHCSNASFCYPSPTSSLIRLQILRADWPGIEAPTRWKSGIFSFISVSINVIYIFWLFIFFHRAQSQYQDTWICVR